MRGPEMPDIAMVEAYVPGRELTVSVLGDRALGVTEIHTAGGYDYHAKYAPGGSKHILPADLPPAVASLSHSRAELPPAAITSSSRRLLSSVA